MSKSLFQGDFLVSAFFAAGSLVPKMDFHFDLAISAAVPDLPAEVLSGEGFETARDDRLPAGGGPRAHHVPVKFLCCGGCRLFKVIDRFINRIHPLFLPHLILSVHLVPEGHPL